MTAMDLAFFRTTLAELRSKVDMLEKMFTAAGGAPAATPAPAVLAPNPLYEMDANRLLTHVRQVGNMQVAPVVGKDCPDTVVLPETGHVLSIPRPDLGEMFMGYCQRTAAQTTNDDPLRVLNTLGALFMGSDYLFAPEHYKEDGSNWARAADKFANIKAYMTPEEKARDETSKAEWAKWDEVVKARAQKEREQQQPKQPDGTSAGAPVDFSPQPTALPEGETPL
jgi:hypothetical protein